MSYNYEKYLKTYTSKLELPGSGEEVEIRPLTTNDMKKLLTYENQNDPLVSEDILDEIITNVVVSENFNIESLYLQDRYYIFIKLRELTKGSKYKFQYKCTSCGQKTIQTIDLNDLNVTNIKPKEENDKLEVMNGNLTLEMNHATRKEHKEALKTISKKLNDNQKQVERIIAELAILVKAINTPDGQDIPDIKSKMEFIGNLPQGEYNTLQEWKKDNDFGIDLTININCQGCGYEEETVMPLDNFFT